MRRALVLGHRRGFDAVLARRGLEPLYVVEKVKPDVAEKPHLHISSLQDVQQLLRAVLAAGATDVEAIVTGHEEAVFSAAMMRSWLDLPGDRDYVRALRFRDKHVQKRSLSAAVPRAECEYVTTASDYERLAARLGEPFVVKPADGYGAMRTQTVSSAEELGAYLAAAPVSGAVSVVAESFIDGDEIHVDGIWQEGALMWSCVSRYARPLMGWNSGAVLGDCIVGRDREPRLCAAAEVLAARALGDLDAPDTVFHLEAFCSGGAAGQLVFGEVGARAGGALIPEMIQLTFGVDLYEATTALALGEPATVPSPPSAPESYYGYVYLRRPRSGRLTAADIRAAIPGICELDFPEDPDARIRSYGRVGHAMLRADDSACLLRRVNELATLSERGLVSERAA